MTSDREDRRVRRGHAWAREAQDFAPRHAQDPLPLRRSRSFSLSFSPPPRHPACPFSRSQRGPRALPPFSLALSPRNSARLAGVMPARSSACMQARCTVLSGGWRDEQWLLCIHVPSSSLLLVVPRNDQDLPMIFNAGSATRAAELLHVGVA